MAPIFDTDLGKERFEQAEWNHYELWEKQLARQRRKRLLWILSTAALFLILSSVPVVIERLPKWTTLSLARVLAVKITDLKTQAASEDKAYRLSFVSGSLEYVVERAESCESDQWEKVSTERLGPESYTLLSSETGQKMGVARLLDRICYDPLKGRIIVNGDEKTFAFGLIPVKDLADQTVQRVSLVMLDGPSAEISLE